MFDLRLPSPLLAILVAAPAVLAGRLMATGDFARAGQVALAEALVILIAGALASQRSLD